MFDAKHTSEAKIRTGLLPNVSEMGTLHYQVVSHEGK
jgi:hypothetical protein